MENNLERLIFESYLGSAAELSLEATLDCGQCFRWQRDDSFMLRRGSGGQFRSGGVCPNNSNDNSNCSDSGVIISYRGIVCGLPLFVWSDGISVWGRGFGVVEFWRDYFDLGRDYGVILSQFNSHPFTQAAIKFGRGLRVLRQDTWETLGSYIISQNNNIPKICSSISKLCVLCGGRIDFCGCEFYSFPSAVAIASLGESDLRQIGLGYRAEYLLHVSRAVAEGKINLEVIKKLPTEAAREKLLQLRGVGPKVANCVLLFGMGKLDAFPIDTWIAKAAEYYDNKLDGSQFGKYAGIAQEYIFYYIRKGINKK
ncbi:MAG: hypothetical protein LBP59_15410 [Planctomycetaceae bacterium]|jgi:N-glycosylase/DNA lyase|nr:hypothetical protein [Planctomycetaceae bacterium]